MLTSLRSKFIFLVVIMVVIYVSIGAVFVIMDKHQYLYDSLLKKAELFGRYTANSVYEFYSSYYVYKTDKDLQKFKELIDPLLAKNKDVVNIELITRSGKIVFDSYELTRGWYKEDAERRVTDKLLLEGIKKLERRVTLGELEPVLGHELIQEGKKVVGILCPVALEDTLVSVVNYHLSVDSIDRAIFKTTLVILVIAIGLIILGVILVFFLADIIIKPIDKLIQGVKRISAGDLKYKVPIKTRDEIGLLADSFNQMTEDLQKITVSRDELAKEINERKRAEAALRNSEERFRIAAESASDFIYEWDIKSGELVWFGNIDGNLGYEPGEFPRTIAARERLIYSEDRQKVSGQLDRHLKMRAPYHAEYRVLRKDNSILYWIDRGTALWDENGNPYKMFGACTDITERKKAEIAIQESKQRLADIINFSPDATFVIDVEGRVIAWNKAIEEMTGVKAEDIIGKGNYEYALPFYGERKPILVDFVSKPEIYPEAEKEYPFITKDKDILIIEIFLPNLRGRGVFVWAKASPLYDANSKLIGAIETVRDITERKKSEEELKIAYDELKKVQAQLVQSSKMASVGLLAGGVAHEINNPLTGVLNNVQLIKMMSEEGKGIGSSEFKDVLSVIEGSALRCKKITQSLLDFSHASKGTHKIILLNEIVEKVISLIQHELSLQNIEIKKELELSLPLILGDAQLLQQVIFDLVSNAHWAIKKKEDKEAGVITIKTLFDKVKKNVNVFISDNGIGIAKEDLTRIFEPFFTTKNVGEGTGLGLSIVYSIIQSHKGTVEVESELDKGTTFKISFPIS